MTKKTFKRLCLSVILCVVSSFMAAAQATSEVVEITQAGTLEACIKELESSRFESLTIKGNLNSEDIAYLISGTGKVALIETLDLTDVKLVESDTPYTQINIGSSGGASGYKYAIYYCSDKYEIRTESSSNGLGGHNQYIHIHCNTLAGAFSKTAFETVILPESIDAVGEYMFYENHAVKNVVIKGQPEYIGKNAFRRTSNLESDIVLPKSVKRVDDYAFDSSAIKSITFPSSLDSIGVEAFYGSDLKSVNLENIKKMGSGAFFSTQLSGLIDLSSLEVIPDFAFYNVENGKISDVKFSDNLKDIGVRAFYCSSLEKIEFPETLERIGEDAFGYNRNLTSVRLPSGIKQIGCGAFEGTPWENNLTATDGIYYIGNIAYKYDSSYKDDEAAINFRDGTIAISDGFSFPNELKKTVTSINLPSTFENIGDRAFFGFRVLGKVEFPKSLYRIGDQAFEECTKFWTEEFHEGITHIGHEAFKNCMTISSLVLPESLKELGNEAFGGCNLGKLSIKSKNLNVGDSYSSFSNASISKVIIEPMVEAIPAYLLCYSEFDTLEFTDPENSKLKYLGDDCFPYRFTLNNFPANLEYIGDSVFGGSTFKENPELKGVKHIGEYSFSSCSGITQVILPEEMDTIGANAFSGCLDLVTVVINAKHLNKTPNVSTGCDGVFNNNENLIRVVVGKNVEYLPNEMFYGCRNINEIEFQGRDNAGIHDISNFSPLYIDDYCFQSNGFMDRGIKELNLPEGLTGIGEHAFGSWFNLDKVSFPSTLTEVGKNILGYCHEVSSIYFYASEPPVFNGYLCDDDDISWWAPNIFVPEESVDAYKAVFYLQPFNILPMPGSSTDIVNDVQKDDDMVIEVYDITGKNVMSCWEKRMPGIYIVKTAKGKIKKILI